MINIFCMGRGMISGEKESTTINQSKFWKEKLEGSIIRCFE